MSPQIVYHSATVDVTLAFVRGPLNFCCYWEGRVHDNLSTSGAARERVVENLDLMIEFDMPHMLLMTDLVSWESFMAWALAGGGFKFYPCSTLTDYYNCVLEDPGFKPGWNAPQKYGAKVKIRILVDGQTPVGPDIVLRRFYGRAA